MGTSGPYTPSPNWSKTKTDVTRILNDILHDKDVHDLIGDFVDRLLKQPKEGFGKLPTDFGQIDLDAANQKLNKLLGHLPKLRRRSTSSLSTDTENRGSGALSASSAAGTRSKSVTSGRGRTRGRGSGAVRPVAQRLASFISEVPKVGLRQALVNAGVVNVDDLPPEQIALAVADVLLTDATLLIETELRDALSTVLEQLCTESATIEQAEKMLSASAYDLQSVIQKLFECYIMERFKTFFCEHEAPKHGYDAADKIVREAREYVEAEMQLAKAERRDLTAVDWTGSEGSQIVDAILERTIVVYTDT